MAFTNKDAMTVVSDYCKANGLSTNDAIMDKASELAGTIPSSAQQKYNFKTVWQKAAYVLKEGGELDPEVAEKVVFADPADKKPTTSKPKKVTNVTLSAKESVVRDQLNTNIAEMIALGAATSVVKVIKKLPDIAEVAKDAHATFVVPMEVAPARIAKLDALKDDVTEETRAVYEELYKAVKSGTPIEANLTATNKTWIGAQIKTPNETKILSKKKLVGWLSMYAAGQVGQNIPDALGLKLRQITKTTSTANSTKDIEDYKSTVVLTNRKKVSDAGNLESYYVTAYVKDAAARKYDSAGNEVAFKRGVRSKKFFEVYVKDKAGNKVLKADKKTYKTRKVTVSGQIEVFGTVASNYFIDDFASARKTGNGGGSGANSLNTLIELAAQNLCTDKANLSNSSYAAGLDPDYVNALSSLKYSAGGDQA